MSDPILRRKVRNERPRRQLVQLHASARERMRQGAAPRRLGQWSNAWSRSERAAQTRQKRPSDIALPTPAQKAGMVNPIPAGHLSDKEQQDRIEEELLRQIRRAGLGSRQRAQGERDLHAWRQQGRPTAENARIALARGQVKGGAVYRHTRQDIVYAGERNHPEGQVLGPLDRMVRRAFERGLLKAKDNRATRKMRKRWDADG